MYVFFMLFAVFFSRSDCVRIICFSRVSPLGKTPSLVDFLEIFATPKLTGIMKLIIHMYIHTVGYIYTRVSAIYIFSFSFRYSSSRRYLT